MRIYFFVKIEKSQMVFTNEMKLKKKTIKIKENRRNILALSFLVKTNE